MVLHFIATLSNSLVSKTPEFDARMRMRSTPTIYAKWKPALIVGLSVVVVEAEIEDTRKR